MAQFYRPACAAFVTACVKAVSNELPPWRDIKKEKGREAVGPDSAWRYPLYRRRQQR
jgi:hypothetical protein